MQILLTAFHTLQFLLAEFNRFPGLESPGKINAIIKFQDFPGFLGPV